MSQCHGPRNPEVDPGQHVSMSLGRHARGWTLSRRIWDLLGVATPRTTDDIGSVSVPEAPTTDMPPGVIDMRGTPAEGVRCRPDGTIATTAVIIPSGAPPPKAWRIHLAP